MPSHAREVLIFVAVLAGVALRMRARQRQKRTDAASASGSRSYLDLIFRGRSVPAAMLVARTELSQRLGSRAYRILLVIMVLGPAGAIVVPRLLASSHSSVVVATTANGARTLDAVSARVDDLAGVTLHIEVKPTVADVNQSVRTGGAAIGYANSALVLKRPLTPGSHSSTLTVADSLAQEIQVAKVLSSKAVTSLPRSVVTQILSPKPIQLVYLLPSVARPKDLALATVGVAATFMLLSTYGSWVLMGVIEEKSSRVIEVLLSSISARSLLLGKMLGIGIAALTQATTAIVVTVATSLAVGSSVLRGAGLEFMLLQLLWVLLGYSFYCTLGALAGSLVSKVEDAQSVTAFIQIPLVLSYLASFAVFSGSQNVLLRALAYVPVFSPFLVPIYWSSGQMGLGLVFLAVLINLLCIYFTYRLASAVYQATVFARGRKLKFKAAVRLAQLPN